MQPTDVALLIVDGLNLSTTEVDVRKLFTPFGSVVSCRISVDRCGNSLRYGYVVMDTADHADKAIEVLNGQVHAGLQITVAHATRSTLLQS